MMSPVFDGITLKRRSKNQPHEKCEEELPWDSQPLEFREQFEITASRIHERMLAELALIDQEQSEAVDWSETRLKQLTVFLKALQGMEEMMGRFEEKRDQDTQDTRDILEFRRELEKRITGITQER